MQFTIQDSVLSLPVGNYKLQFRGVEECETKVGHSYKWTFANKPPSTKNKMGRWLSALANKPITAGTTINPDDYIGKTYLVIVEPNDNGGTRINTFTNLA
jgi:hypothetical protein